MSDSSPVPPAESKTRQQLRAERRARAREQARAIEVEEPEIPPTICAWCGFSAYFDDEATDAEKEKCPACAVVYDDASTASPAFTDDQDELDKVRRDCVHRRIANALDLIGGILEEQWAVQQAAMERRY